MSGRKKDDPRLKRLLRELGDCDEEQKCTEERRARVTHELKALRSRAAQVLRRFEGGECVMVVRGVHWWNRDGHLGLRLTQSEREGLEELDAMQVLERVVKIARV